MRSTYVIAALLVVIVIIAVSIAVLRQSTQPASPMSYVNNFRDLLSNGSFTATYSGSYVEISITNTNNEVIRCNSTSDFSVGSINGSRAFIDVIKTTCNGLASNVQFIPMQEMAYWINGSDLCEAAYVVMNNHGSGSINCLPLGRYSVFTAFLPFDELLGNATFAIAVQGYSINYSITTYINYVNTTKWHGQAVYCFNVISNLTRAQSMAGSLGLRSSNDITELICLLPNGLPAIRIINETVVLSPLSSRSTYMYVVQSKSELVNYTLSYFNVTAFNELISMARSQGNG